jgi:protein phosphatase methylesterase 1
MFDCRGHGATITEDDCDLSLERLTADFENIFNHVKLNAKQVFLIGHSLGGAVVVNAMSKGLGSIVKGIVVLDVVEGSAIESLSKMNTILATRPRQFSSVQEAIAWAYGIVFNLVLIRDK